MSAPALLTSRGQAFLVGDEVYLRPFAPADADYVQSWTFSRFPISPDRIRARIDDGETGDDASKGRVHLLIVRRADDRPVGSVAIDTGEFLRFAVDAVVDPIFGADGTRWKGEAVAMAMRHAVEEWQEPIIITTVAGDETAVIDALERAGARRTSCVRQALARAGRRVDALLYERFHSGWVDRLGDPAGIAIPRSGTGQPRPVIPPVLPQGDPPANAVRIGPRVYLRPVQESDARAAAHWVARETDPAWANGRFIHGAGEFWGWVKGDQAATPPDRVDFMVCLRDSDDPIGFVGCLAIDWRHRTGVTASEIIDPGYREAGYGTEAKHLLFDYLFNQLGLHVLQSWVYFDNTRSAAALRKQGYREAGRVHWRQVREGAFTNMCIFDLLAEEWRAMPRREPGASE